MNKIYADGHALDVVRSPLTFCDDQYIYSLGMWIVDTNIYEGDGHEGVVMCEWKCVGCLNHTIEFSVYEIKIRW